MACDFGYEVKEDEETDAADEDAEMYARHVLNAI